MQGTRSLKSLSVTLNPPSHVAELLGSNIPWMQSLNQQTSYHTADAAFGASLVWLYYYSLPRARRCISFKSLVCTLCTATCQLIIGAMETQGTGSRAIVGA